MHDMRLIHTDLKPENILFVSPDYIKIPDYKDYKVHDISSWGLNKTQPPIPTTKRKEYERLKGKEKSNM